MNDKECWTSSLRQRDKERERFKHLTFAKQMPMSGTSWDFTRSVWTLSSLCQLCELHLSLPFMNLLSQFTHQEMCEVTLFITASQWGWEHEPCLRIHKGLKQNVNCHFPQTRTMAAAGWFVLLVALLSMAFAVAHSEYWSPQFLSFTDWNSFRC